MSSYQWQNAVDFTARFSRNLPITAIDEQICDMVSSEIWTAYPWNRLGSTQTNIAAGLIPLVDGTQDYSVPSNLYRLLTGYINRTDTTPDVAQELNVVDFGSVDLVKRSYTQIRSVGHQAGFGVLRLESAVSVPSGMTLELGGTYQTNPPKITALTTIMWIDDRHFNIACEGLLYWLYKLGDDPRAGGIQKVENGRAVYTGQYAQFRNLIDVASAEEDLGGTTGYFPSEPIGSGRDLGGGLNIFPGS